LIAAMGEPILGLVAGIDGNRGAKRGREARDQLGLGQDGPLDDVLDVVEQRGGAHALVLKLPDDVAGAYLKRPGRPMLVVCGTEYVPRQRFTLAHEFGHFRMGHEAVIDKPEVIFGGRSHDPHEVQANAFAAEFLVPKKAMRAWLAARPPGSKITLEHVVELACEYGVSAKMMRIRLATTECITDQALSRRLDAEIEDKFHLELVDRLGLTPLTDSLTAAAQHLPRLPGSIRNSQLGDLLLGRETPESIAERTGRPVEKVRESLAAMGIDQLLPAAG
jgi:Zn-dependent peptidase ImmA (M78 family)